MYGYFQLQALLGITKHPGGVTFTRRLIERCGVDRSTSLLYVGGGSGRAAAKIVELTGCELTSIDLLPEMAHSALRYAGERTTLLAADAEHLPFCDNAFDAVISESVTGFTNPERSLAEYWRVLAPGGHVGLNEVTWLEDPSPEILEYIKTVQGLHPRNRENWIAALEQAQFREIDVETGPLRVMEQLSGEMQMIDRHYFSIASRFFSLLVTDPRFRSTLRQMTGSSLRVPRGFLRTFGYGLYVARK